MSRIYEIDFELPDPISIANKKTGMMDELSVINLRAPSRRNAKEASIIKNICMTAIMGASGGLSEDEKEKIRLEQAKKDAGENDSNELSADGLLLMLYASKGIDLDNLFSVFEKLLINGCGYALDGQITSGILDKLSFEDFERLFGEYIANFLLQSLTGKNGKN